MLRGAGDSNAVRRQRTRYVAMAQAGGAPLSIHCIRDVGLMEPGPGG